MSETQERLAEQHGGSKLRADAGLEGRPTDQLLRDLSSSDRATWDAAIEGLGKRKSAVPSLSVVANDRTKSNQARWGAVSALARIKDPASEALFIECLKDDYGAIRGSACWGLSRIGGKRASDALLEYLRVSLEQAEKDQVTWGDVIRAAEAQRDLPDERALPLLLKCVELRRDPYGCAAEALGKIGDPSASELLAAQLKVEVGYSMSKDYLYLDAVKTTKGPKAAPLLVKYLRDLVVKMKGQESPGADTPTRGSENRQRAYNFEVYGRTVSALEAVSGKKSIAGTREEVADHWSRWLLAEQKQESKSVPPRKRGTATAEVTRPERFPHRIWAACDFEGQTPDYAWFGPAEKTNIPAYPGNLTALGVKEKPYGKFSALMTGINPVPGPMMGKLNRMYCRYYLKGGTEATFQHFSLSVEDNNHIRVSGLTEGKWAEATLNFTRDAARNDGSRQAFQKGERMDDLKVFVGKPGDGRNYELLLDDVIFFDDDPDMPRETEPFPRRVIFLAAFDTGIDRKSKPKYWPGEFDAVTKSGGAPADSYWGVARAVPQKDTKGKWVRLEVRPPRPVGARTKLRFRYFLSGAKAMTAQIFDLTARDNRHIVMKGVKENAWQWAILDFTADSKRNDGSDTPFAAGNKVDDIFFFVNSEDGSDVQLHVDEVTLFDAGTAGE